MISPERGTLLIANPFLKDPNFKRTVIFICENAIQGALGFVLNKPFPQNLDELIPDLKGYKYPVFIGGPVQGD
jgi:putative transcriptional regulator